MGAALWRVTGSQKLGLWEVSGVWGGFLEDGELDLDRERCAPSRKAAKEANSKRGCHEQVRVGVVRTQEKQAGTDQRVRGRGSVSEAFLYPPIHLVVHLPSDKVQCIHRDSTRWWLYLV